MGDLLVPGVRFALYADLMLLTGLAAFPLHAFDRAERHIPALLAIVRRPQPWLCAFGLLVSAAGMVILTADMQGVQPDAVDPAMLLGIIGETGVGAAWTCRMVALLLAAAALWRLASHPVIAAWAVATTGAIALATLAWSGHAAASEGLAGTIHRASDALHVVAAAIWIGAIAAFLLLLRPRHGAVPPEYATLAARGLDRFARTGTLCVLVIAATGLVNAQAIVGIANVGQALASPYGQWMLAKLLLFAAMLGLAAANRWRLTPALRTALVEGEAAPAIGAIRRSLAAEILAGLAILALIGWLGLLDPLP
ncbi:MAG: copper homeostasis membrane protein CopD [Sphingopyxis sp.]